jgi:leucyl/phenylalanyl-tRNA--protein transferase
VALVSLVRQLQTWGFRLMDCQQSSPHIKGLGAEDIPRREFLNHLAAALTLPNQQGRWKFDYL